MNDLEYLLNLDDEVYPLDSGYWVKFEARKVEKTVAVPHGVKYSITLHDKRNHRCILHCDKSDFDANEVQIFWENIREVFVEYDWNNYISKEINIEGVIFPNIENRYGSINNFFKKFHNRRDYYGFSHNVKFLKCTFISNFDLSEVSSDQKITFNNCTFEGDIQLNIANEIEIVNSKFKNEISLGSPNWQKVYINNTEFKKDVNLTAKEQLSISNSCIFRGNLKVDGGIHLILNFESSSCNKELSIQNTIMSNITNVKLKSNVFFKYRNSVIHINDINFKKDVSFDEFSKLSIVDSEFNQKINFGADLHDEMIIDNTKLINITLKSIAILKIINNSEINGNLELAGKYQVLNIENSKVNKKLNVQDVISIDLKSSSIGDSSQLNGHYGGVSINKCHFKDLSIKNASAVNIDDINVEGNLDLLGEKYESISIDKSSISDTLQISEVTKLELSNIKSNPSVKLVHDIYDDVNIKDVRFHDLEINAVKSLNIQKSIIKGKLKLLGEENDKIILDAVIVKNNCNFPKVHALTIQNKSKFYKDVFFTIISNTLFMDSEFKSHVEFFAEFEKIRFSGCEFHEPFRLLYSSCNNLEMEDCRFHKEVNLSESEFEKINITSSIFEGNLLLVSSKIQSIIFPAVVEASNNIIIGKVDFTSSFVDTIKINDSGFSDELNFINMKNEINLSSISDTTIEKLNVTNSSVKDLFLYSNNLNITELAVENSKLNSSTEEIEISEIVIDDFKCNKIVLLKNMSFSKMTIDKFRIGNSNIEDRFRIKESDIGVFNLIASTFEDLQIIDNMSGVQERVRELRLKNTTIKNAVLDKLEYNSFIMSTAHVSEAKIGYVEFEDGSRETNRFFKNYYDSISDYIKANIYYQQEMQEHYKTTSDKWEKVVLFLGKWISDFGQSWVRPLLWIVLLTVIVLSFIHLDKFSFDYIFSNKLNIWNGFWEFLNPFSKRIQDNYKDVYGVWMIHKLVMTVFIYHFVVAIKRKTQR